MSAFIIMESILSIIKSFVQTFQGITLLIALLCLIVILFILAILMSFKNTSLKFPPVYGPCPDFWKGGPDNTCRIPNTVLQNKPTGSLATDNTPGYNDPFINFNDDKWSTLYSTTSKQCALKKWTNTFKVEWDGISNYNNC